MTQLVSGEKTKGNTKVHQERPPPSRNPIKLLIPPSSVLVGCSLRKRNASPQVSSTNVRRWGRGFDVGRRLKNLDDLKQIGFAANRRLLGVQTLSHDCTIGAEAFHDLHRPVHINGQRASALRFGDPRVQALLAALLRFDLLPAGFRNRELREAVAPLRGLSLDDYNAGQMTYDLRRLRLRGLIERIPHSQRFRLTAEGLCSR